MIVLIIFIILSFLLDGLLSTLITINNIFMFKSFFTLISIIIIFPYLTKNKNTCYIISFITGLIFDLTYTNTLFLNASLFLFMCILIQLLYKILKNNLFNGIVILIITIFIYNISTYFILNIIGFNTYPLLIFIKQFIFIILINTLYFIIFYILIKKYADNNKIEYIDK